MSEAAAETVVTPVPEQPRAPRALPPARLKLVNENQIRREWLAIPEEGTPYEAVFSSLYWAHHAARIRCLDLIEVIPDDSSYRAVLMVRSQTGSPLIVSELSRSEFDAPASSTAVSDKYKVKYKGPHWMHTVIRIADNEPVQTGFSTPEAAHRWIFENAKRLQLAA